MLYKESKVKDGEFQNWYSEQGTKNQMCKVQVKEKLYSSKIDTLKMDRDSNRINI